MLEFLRKMFRGDNTMNVNIIRGSNGFTIVARDGSPVGAPYGRRRDAVRGAKRRGFVIA